MKKSLISGIDNLKKVFSQACPENIASLGDLYREFEEVENIHKVEFPTELMNKYGRAKELIEELILEKSENVKITMEEIEDIIKSIKNKPNDAQEEKTATMNEILSDQEIFNEFLSSQDDNLLTLQNNMLIFEKSPKLEIIAEIKRQFHTLKGDAGLLGLDDVERICHFAEDIIDEEEATEIPSILLDIKDWLSQKFATYLNVENISLMPIEEFINARIVTISQRKNNQIESSIVIESENINNSQSKDCNTLELIDEELIDEFVSESMDHLEQSSIQLLNLETDPENKTALDAIFRAFHTIKGGAGFLEFDKVKQVAHESEALLENARSGKLLIVDKATDVIFNSIDILKLLIEGRGDSSACSENVISEQIRTLKAIIESQTRSTTTNGGSSSDYEIATKNIGDILIESGKVKPEDIQMAVTKQNEHPDDQNKPRIGEVLIKEQKIEAIDVAHALRIQKNQSRNVKVEKRVIKETIKMDSARLSSLLDTIGELVIIESMVQRSITSFMGEDSKRFTELDSQIGHLGKITRELQESATSMRMVSLNSVFQKMARLARDLSRKSGKKILFKMQGEDTELDKSVVDAIGDPLIHMIRNAIDHGVENVQIRKQLGKSEEGTVILRAFHQGGSIFIEVEDDGQGLDPEKLLTKGRKLKIVNKDDNLSEQEIYNLIFAPGFSTAETVTDISGRGVGMDVVNKTIESLQGQIEIKSELGKGLKFTFKLPLTLAIIDGMIVRAGSERFIIPSLLIVRTVELVDKHRVTLTNKGEIYSLANGVIPLFKLSQVFNIKETPPQGNCKKLIVIVEINGVRVGIVIDEVLDKQQVVIKGLGDTFKDIKGISGGAIMSDGKVGLIIDVNGMLKLAS